MEEAPLLRLNLLTALEYVASPLAPFEGLFPAVGESAEFLFCFDIDPAQAARIDPEPAAFPGALVFSGKRAGGHGESAPAGDLRLPAGLYAFMQKRRELSMKECAALAIELQKDGLWERLRLESRLYVRFLFEDGSPVTQLFRPCDDF